MHDGLRRALKAAVTVPIGGVVGYAFCHDPSLEVLFAIHGMLLAPLALVSAGTARWIVLVFCFAATSGLIAAENELLFNGALTHRPLIFNAIFFAVAAGEVILLRTIASEEVSEEL